MSKGTMTIGMGVLLGMITVITSAVGGFYSAQIGTNEKINTANAAVVHDIGKNTTDIAVAKNSSTNLESKVDELGDDFDEMSKDIKEILRFLR